MQLQLRNKLSLAVSAVILIVSLPVCCFSISESLKAGTEHADRVASTVARKLAQVEISGIKDGSRLAEEILSVHVDDAFKLSDLLAYIVVVDQNGQLRAGRINGKLVRIKGGNAAGLRTGLENLAKKGQGLAQGLVVDVVEINDGAKLLGRVKAAVSLTPMRAKLHRDICKYVAVTFILLGIGMVASNLLAYRISRGA